MILVISVFRLTFGVRQIFLFEISSFFFWDVTLYIQLHRSYLLVAVLRPVDHV